MIKKQIRYLQETARQIYDEPLCRHFGIGCSCAHCGENLSDGDTAIAVASGTFRTGLISGLFTATEKIFHRSCIDDLEER